MTARIVGANVRDLSYIASNLRPEDHSEVDCQFDEWSPALLAYIAMQGFAYVVELDGNPEAAFGATRQRTGLFIIWSWGTKRMWRCVPRIIDFCLDTLIPDVLAAGACRGEARALVGHKSAHRLIERVGGRRQGVIEAYGKNGEDFILWEWTRETCAAVLQKGTDDD